MKKNTGNNSITKKEQIRVRNMLRACEGRIYKYKTKIDNRQLEMFVVILANNVKGGCIEAHDGKSLQMINYAYSRNEIIEPRGLTEDIKDNLRKIWKDYVAYKIRYDMPIQLSRRTKANTMQRKVVHPIYMENTPEEILAIIMEEKW